MPPTRARSRFQSRASRERVGRRYNPAHAASQSDRHHRRTRRSPTLIGRILAHYRITAELGSGGRGEVYRATDLKLGREVALKVLPAEMASSPERLERFRREGLD
jgi:serine/threonine protein kinase